MISGSYRRILQPPSLDGGSTDDIGPFTRCSLTALDVQRLFALGQHSPTLDARLQSNGRLQKPLAFRGDR
jgi:hypothetical protein